MALLWKRRASFRVPVHSGQSETIDGVVAEIDFNQDGRFITHDPAFMLGFHGYELGGLVLNDAPICKAYVNLAARHESDMGVGAQPGSHEAAQIGRPRKSHRIDHAFHANIAGQGDVHLDTTDILVLVRYHWFQKRISRIHPCMVHRATKGSANPTAVYAADSREPRCQAR